MGGFARTLFTASGPFTILTLLWGGVCCPAYAFRPADARERRQPTAAPVRKVRVLVASGVRRIRFRAAGPISIEDGNHASLGVHTAGDWLVTSRHGASEMRLGDVVRFAEAALLRPQGGDSITVSVYRGGDWSPGVAYSGALRLSRGADDRLDLVNEVDVERYVACVVASEVWPTFETIALRAQAIAARTFVLYQMKRRGRAAFDVSATQGSQVYRGLRTDRVGRRAAEAASYTRGIVLSWRSDGKLRLFCTYYSAACGGMSQSAAIFGEEGDIEPLRGGVRCDECRIAPGGTYRWGPVRMKEAEVRSRLISVYPKMASLGRIREIKVLEKTPSGRPVRLSIVGSGGESFDLLAERFRLAIGGSTIRSTDCRIRVSEDEIVFDKGRGFGHGLGLCQWGMQGLALKGKRASEILRHYYPGSSLARAY